MAHRPRARALGRILVGGVVVGLGLVMVGGVAPVHAGPADAPADKVDAKSLMQSGLKLLKAKDYLGALAVFRDAYARFPGAKILLNIGTTLKLLGRDAEAANAYQRYLDAGDADPTKQADVAKAIAELDARVGVLAVRVIPDGAEVQLGDEWLPAAQARAVRVAPGGYTLHARHAGYEDGDAKGEVAVGQRAEITIALRELAKVVAPRPVDDHPDLRDGVVVRAPAPPSRLGALVVGHVDVTHKGAAALVGASFAITPHLDAIAAALLGPSSGAYLGAQLALTGGRLRPLLAVGVPVFFSGGPRVAVRGAAGVEFAATRNLSLTLELGVEHLLNPEADIKATGFIPALGATARL
jgi:hypothetical protein